MYAQTTQFSTALRESPETGKVHESIHGREGMSLALPTRPQLGSSLWEQMGLLASFQFTLRVAYNSNPNCEWRKELKPFLACPWTQLCWQPQREAQSRPECSVHFFPSLVKSKLAGKLLPELSAVLVHGNLHGWLIHLNHTLPCSPPPPKQEPKVAVWFCTENS